MHKLKSSEIYASHFARMWPDRNDERVFVFASGYVYDKAARRQSIRQNIASQRNFRKRGD